MIWIVASALLFLWLLSVVGALYYVRTLRANARMQNTQLATLQTRRLKLEEDLVHYQGLAKLHMDNNLAFERQRTQAYELYYKSSRQAGNAQHLLFGELEKLLREVNRLRSEMQLPPVKLDSQLKVVVDSFQQEHTNPQLGRHS